jgi:hypothetical protein
MEAKGRPDPSWVCEPLQEKDPYLRFVALHSITTPSDKNAKDKLIGTFAIAKQSDLVLGFEKSGNRLVTLKSRTAKRNTMSFISANKRLC